jgi:hypothetical protein
MKFETYMHAGRCIMAPIVCATDGPAMTPTPEGFRHIAIESLIDAIATHRSDWPPPGWCDAFDAAHSYIPEWACHQPHAAFVEHCRDASGPNALARHAALASSLRRWLRDNQDCPELKRATKDARAAFADRDIDPQTWAPYAAYLENHDAPY